MSKQRLPVSAMLALAAGLIFQAVSWAGTYSVRVFNPDGTAITADSVTLNVSDSKNTTILTQKTTTGTFVFTVTSNQKKDASVTFNFTRQSTGTQFIITGICVQPTSPPTKTMDIVLP